MSRSGKRNGGRSALIVVPCYDERDRLDLGAFEAFVDRRDDVGFLFVDDGSTDGTGALLEEAASRRPDAFHALRLAENRGKAVAVWSGLREAVDAGADVTGYLDADLSTPLEELGAMLDHLKRRPELRVLLGSRVLMLGYTVERRAARHYFGRVFATFASLILRMPVYDTQCGAKLFRVGPELESALESPFRTGWIFDVELLARLKRRLGPPSGGWIEERPLRTWRDAPGSKVRPHHLFGVARDLLRLWLREPR